jgi:hypothetical protein
MRVSKFFKPFTLGICLLIAGCGTHLPYVGEVWNEEGWREVGVNDNLAIKIRAKVFCDLVEAANSAIGTTYYPDPEKGKASRAPYPVLKNFGVQMQLTITIDETGAIDPSGALTHILPNALVGKVVASQSVSLNSSAVISSQAVRIDTYYSYFTIERLTNPKNKELCSHRNTTINTWSNLLSDLRIKEFLGNATYSATIIHSSEAPAKGNAKTAKFDIFSYDTKFVVQTSLGINPVVKLASQSVGSGTNPLVNANRTRTHELLLTFGPDNDGPITAALNIHLNAGSPKANAPSPAQPGS